MGSNSKGQFNDPLPEYIIEGGMVSKEAAVRCLEQFLKQTLPSSDQKHLKGDLKWQFILEQHSLVKTNKRKPKKTFLTRKQRKEMDLFKLPKDQWNYQLLESVRQLWKEYMRENLDLVKSAPNCQDQDWNTFSVIVAKSEMVGAELKVVKSKVPSLVGMAGTVVLETKMAFQIVTPQNKLKTILKDTSVFEFVLDKLKFTFLGKHLATRPSHRCAKKLKNFRHADI